MIDLTFWSIFGGDSCLLCAKFALLFTEGALLRAQFGFLIHEEESLLAQLALQFAEPALELTEHGLEFGQFLLGEGLAHGGLHPGHGLVELGHLLADVGSRNDGGDLYVTERLLLFAKYFLLTSEHRLLFAEIVQRLIGGLNLRDDGGVIDKVGFAFVGKPEEVPVGQLARFIDIGGMNFTGERQVLAVIAGDDGIGIPVAGVVVVGRVALCVLDCAGEDEAAAIPVGYIEMNDGRRDFDRIDPDDHIGPRAGRRQGRNDISGRQRRDGGSFGCGGGLVGARVRRRSGSLVGHLLRMRLAGDGFSGLRRFGGISGQCGRGRHGLRRR